MGGTKRISIAAGVVLLGTAAMAWGSGRLDRTAPVITVHTDSDRPVGDTLILDVDLYDRTPGLGGHSVLIDGNPVEWRWEDRSLVIETSGLADGEHGLLIEAWDRAWSTNLASAQHAFSVDRTPPEVQLARRSLNTSQGRAHALIVRTTEPVTTPTGVFRAAPVVFHPLDDSGTLWRALAGVPLDARTGRKYLEISVTDEAGLTTERTVPVAVMPGRFSKGGTIRLNAKQLAARKNKSAKKRMRAEREAAYAWEHPEQLWSGPLVRPVDGGRISSGFGRYRTYSDGKKSHHTGTDIAARTGTPVMAAAAGEVRFAGEQAIFGNVVIVNHGQGLSTSYNHLSAIHVEQGQRVAAGERVGDVGTTGQSTGPHLHWGVVLGGTAVDGMPLLEDDLGLHDPAHWTHATEGGQLIPLEPDPTASD